MVGQRLLHTQKARCTGRPSPQATTSSAMSACQSHAWSECKEELLYEESLSQFHDECPSHAFGLSVIPGGGAEFRRRFVYFVASFPLCRNPVVMSVKKNRCTSKKSPARENEGYACVCNNNNLTR